MDYTQVLFAKFNRFEHGKLVHSGRISFTDETALIATLQKCWPEFYQIERYDSVDVENIVESVSYVLSGEVDGNMLAVSFNRRIGD